MAKTRSITRKPPASRKAPADATAIAVGKLYRAGKTSLVDSVKRFVEAGKKLTAKKASLGHGEWLSWLEANAAALDFDTPRTAQRLMGLAANTTSTSHLDEAEALAISRQLWGNDASEPAVNRAPAQDLKTLLRDNEGRPTPEANAFIAEVRAEKTAVKKAVRAAREVDLGAKQVALPTKRFGVILADPAWTFEVYNAETGSDRSAENHYPVQSLDAIKSLDVPSIAATDCALFLWATSPMMPQALEMMAAWGFTYKSQVVWEKDRAGTGYWFWNQHELLLVGTRGNVPAPGPGTQWLSVVKAPVDKHSAKPERFLELIEEYFPSVPKIELNRRGPAREGWSAWGNEAIDRVPTEHVVELSPATKAAPAINDDDLAIPVYLRRVK